MAVKLSNLFKRKKRKTPYIIVIEGLDGAGKETTTKGLKKLMESKGYKVKMISFPMYDKWHSFLVRYFLKGKFGNSPYSVPPKLASLFYSFDRFFAYHFGIKKEIQDYDFLILDRYTTASALYQGAKGKTFDQKMNIVKFIEFIEYTLLRIPKPNKIFALTSTAEQSKQTMNNREKLDINESDFKYQENVYTFLTCLIYFFNWVPIATRQEYRPYEWYPVEDIAETIYSIIDYQPSVKDSKKEQ